MAQFFSPSKRSRAPKSTPAEHQLTVTGLSSEGAGVARLATKPVFVPGALPGETIRLRVTDDKRKLAHGKLLEVISPSAERCEPFCRHFGLARGACGGCQLQHLSATAQREHKQQRLARLLKQQAGLTPEQWAEPVYASSQHYRRRARLAVQWQGRNPVIGFRQRNSDKATDIAACPVLAEPLDDVFSWLKPLLGSLFKGPHITHAEVVLAGSQPVLLLRHTRPLPPADISRLNQGCAERNWYLYLKGPDDRLLLSWPESSEYKALSYSLAELELAFSPQDFIQVNPEVNQQMVAQALEWLEVAPEHRVLDLFCGLGNFSLPLAQRAAKVIGVEGVEAMVERARHNAARNHLANCEFHCADLQQGISQFAWARAGFERILLDPARAGAKGVVEQLGTLGAQRIVYVSCDPATLARDAKSLAEQGYRLHRAGVLDMFPHTYHLESMALFIKQ